MVCGSHIGAYLYWAANTLSNSSAIIIIEFMFKYMSKGNYCASLEKIVFSIIFLIPILRVIVPDEWIYIPFFCGCVGFCWFLANQRQSTFQGGISIVDLMYFLILGYFLIRTIHNVNIQAIVSLLTCLGIWCIMRQARTINEKHIALALSVVTLAESCVALLQHFGTMKSENTFFKVTGTFGNPAILGCYSALAIVFLWTLSFSTTMKRIWGFSIRFVCAISFVTLILADSRTALLAIVLPILLFHCKSLFHRWGKTSTVMGLVLVASLIGLLYLYRPASANSRLHIWKNCRTIMQQAPVFGHGTNSFTSIYMPFQAEAMSIATTKERLAADDVLSPYNELLKVGCELGSIGMLLTLFFTLLVIKEFTKSHQAANGPYLFFLFAFIIISMLSYPLSNQALRLLSTGIIALGINTRRRTESFMRTKVHIGILHSGILALTILFIGTSIYRIFLYRKISNYAKLEIEFPIKDMTIEDFTIQHDSRLLEYLTSSQMLVGDYSYAIPYLQRYTDYCNTSATQLDLAKTYDYMGSTWLAINHYDIAHKMRPFLMEPLFAKYKLLSEIDPTAALELARFITIMPVKVESPQTLLMRREAASYINTFKAKINL